MRLHVGLEEGVDAGLVTFALGFEPLQHVPVQADAHRALGLGSTITSFSQKNSSISPFELCKLGFLPYSS
jgi:hypothetical protein